MKQISLSRFIPWKIKLSETNIEFILACLVGLGAGFVSVIFRYILHHFHHFFLGVLYPKLAAISINAFDSCTGCSDADPVVTPLSWRS